MAFWDGIGDFGRPSHDFAVSAGTQDGSRDCDAYSHRMYSPSTAIISGKGSGVELTEVDRENILQSLSLADDVPAREREDARSLS